MSETITLGGKEYPVDRVKFGVLRKLVPRFLASNITTDEGMEAAGALIAATIVKDDGTHMTLAEFDEIPMDWNDAYKALDIVAPLVGLKWQKSEPGDAKPGEAKAAA